MIECPDCGKNFRSAKCSCGYEPPRSSPGEVAQRMRELREAADREFKQHQDDYARKSEIIAAIQNTNKRSWAHQILALHAAGQYPEGIGLEMARQVAGVQM